MISIFDYIQKYPRKAKQLLGISYDQFTDLVNYTKKSHKDIIDIKVGYPGPTADIKLFREQQTKFDETQEFEGDKAYQGGNNITTPHKKKRKQQLNEQQKSENKNLSSKRIFVEHLIRVVKIFQVASQRFRLNTDVYNPHSAPLTVTIGYYGS
ncbi:transposase family protein [aff. Roholtiella sp. LEGE 12411]|uniref:transposase family protein n=1 Tax=aff. Roholtiella sp. LEGE 12411 TaxID=1828822 RepID=UPI001882975C|nr:transposase family protein [aff. Roholtiella sp. LEGE 12411]MBE9036248.1 transposase [aff. Roholtiella sp. LEGE 12411]